MGVARKDLLLYLGRGFGHQFTSEDPRYQPKKKNGCTRIVRFFHLEKLRSR